MFKKFRGLFSNDLSIDLGTANTLIYVKGQGIVLDEPSVVAIRQDRALSSKSIAAVGTNAKMMLGRTPQNIKVIRPMKAGVIADFFVTEKMLQYFIKQVHSDNFFQPSPRVVICVPAGATQVERKAIKESAIGAGAREIHLIKEPKAAAIGAGLPIHEATGSMVIDVGGGTTEVAILSLNGIVYSSSIRIGGDNFDDAIIAYVRRHFGSAIGEATAEKIKKEIATAYIGKVLVEPEVEELEEVIEDKQETEAEETKSSDEKAEKGLVAKVKEKIGTVLEEEKDLEDTENTNEEETSADIKNDSKAEEDVAIKLVKETKESVKEEVEEVEPEYVFDEFTEIRTMTVHGHNLAEGVPRAIELTSEDILAAIEQPLNGIVEAVKAVLEQCPPELAVDIFERGMVLTGGGALLHNLDVLLSKECGVPVVVAEDPLTCVARGGGQALDMIDQHGGDLFSDDY